MAPSTSTFILSVTTSHKICYFHQLFAQSTCIEGITEKSSRLAFGVSFTSELMKNLH